MPLPGEGLSNRPLHFIWICDCSGSMSVNGKIQILNTAIRDAIPLMRKEADENPNAEVLVRALKFSSGAQWHIAQPTPVESFNWIDLSTEGVTDMGKALSMVADQLKIPPMTDRALPPVLVLISDGQPTDDFSSGLNKLMEQPWGKKAVRIAIAVGGDADHEVLQKFIGNPELLPLQADSPDALVRQIKWVSTVVLKAASSPSSQTNNSNLASGNVPIPIVPQAVINSASDVW
ncbi:tellurium resistance protein [Cylindrospermopsis raciborskii CENA303]|uniref:Tellurium resistance protein n=2 Tax=Cylindrospermopsis raciborskii TaxID=77022 RepID=A0A1X4G9V4_9CYAN|nr:VWA domain-containing protein [Cylindrospermopsis raciborskii]NLQ04558.1 VWA domain-containing protein [Cylindrospermopsis raciborskii MVCC19]OHY35922.1 tellurium resistance protein [Cylindrospermopsis raciborskii MVCC14]OPH09560.1 tellurium resistance protein [Cylindrospermopsis raciborskii CENA302]OSO93922.1 tellurium resistance protein [Cylindrospermopsis raciborskii CENA303]